MTLVSLIAIFDNCCRARGLCGGRLCWAEEGKSEISRCFSVERKSSPWASDYQLRHPEPLAKHGHEKDDGHVWPRMARKWKRNPLATVQSFDSDFV